MRPQPIPLTLLQQHALQACPHLTLQREVSHNVLWIADGQQLRQLAPGLDDRHEPCSHRGRDTALLLAERVHQLAEILRKPALAVAGRTSGHLQSHRVEPGVITLRVAPDQRLDLIGRRQRRHLLTR
ncbi:MAG: hypothetical protein ACRDRS_18795, partial [Pseudonocardiaceae bacterium]